MTRTMHRFPILSTLAACTAALALVACSETSAPPAPVVIVDPVQTGTPLRFTGQIVLEGATASARDGTIEVSVRNAGSTTPILSRTYAIDDPWRVGGTLAFGLSKSDAVSDPVPPFGREMELVVRFDADGNPATHGDGDREIVQRVPTGSTDILVRVDPTAVDAPRAARAGSK